MEDVPKDSVLFTRYTTIRHCNANVPIIDIIPRCPYGFLNSMT